ncbi:hypothetical protein GCM10009776_12690 [Microbacterium deminutum]|uniref:DUF4175 domain-containing protein n=2 Tax=Microbacterium deminutum TaxID=344164 RepID=A0ABN2QH71_9MICO
MPTPHDRATGLGQSAGLAVPRAVRCVFVAGTAVKPSTRCPRKATVGSMTALAVILLVVGIILLLLGIFVGAAKFLLWVGIVIIVVAIIAWLLRYMRRGA